MKKEGPIMANILLDGIYPENLKMPVTAEDSSIRYNRKPTQPVRGTVLLGGAPVAGAKVVFHAIDNATKKKSYTADALTEADGAFTLSTYQANDGAPVGDYAVTVAAQEPPASAPAKPGPNRLPAKHAAVGTTGLHVQVKSGANNFILELSK